MKNAFNIVVGSLFALVTGFLLYMETAMVFGSPQGDVPTIAFVMFGVGTLGAGYFLLRGTESTGTVFKRSFLMGAIVWIMMVPASLMMSGKAAVETASESGGGEAAQA
jgi:ABC-type transport system involved in multi-copper enzyme maturation permease subunit